MQRQKVEPQFHSAKDSGNLHSNGTNFGISKSQHTSYNLYSMGTEVWSLFLHGSYFPSFHIKGYVNKRDHTF